MCEIKLKGVPARPPQLWGFARRALRAPGTAGLPRSAHFPLRSVPTRPNCLHGSVPPGTELHPGPSSPALGDTSLLSPTSRPQVRALWGVPRYTPTFIPLPPAGLSRKGTSQATPNSDLCKPRKQEIFFSSHLSRGLRAPKRGGLRRPWGVRPGLVSKCGRPGGTSAHRLLGLAWTRGTQKEGGRESRQGVGSPGCRRA